MSKLDNEHVPFIKDITLTYKIMDNNDNNILDLSKNMGWYAGLMIEDTIINYLKTQFNNLNIKNVNLKETDQTNINNIVSIEPASNRNPVYDCIITLGEQKLKTQIKSIQKCNYKNTMNGYIPDGNDLGIVIVYIIDENARNIYVESIEIYLPNKVETEDGTIINSFAEYAKEKTEGDENNKNILVPNKKKAAILIVNNVSNIRTLQQRKQQIRREQKKNK